MTPPTKSSFLIAYLSSALVLLASIALFRIVSDRFGPEGFAEYALARRALAVVYLLSTLGLLIALPRHLGRSSADVAAAAEPLVGSLVAILAFMLPTIAVIMLFGREASALVFGSEEHVEAFYGLCILSVGTVLNGLCYAYLRGLMAIGKASALNVINLALAPLVVFSAIGRSTGESMVVAGCWISLVSLATLAPAITRGLRNWRASMEHARPLLRFGLRRLPGDGALAAFLALPGIVAANSYSLREAGIVAFGGSLLGLSATATAPIGAVLLPFAGRLVVSGDTETLRIHVKRLLWAITVPAVLGAGVGTVLVRPLVALYIGPEMADFAPILRPMILSIPPFAIFACLRNVVDAAFSRAIVGRITLTVLGAFLVCGGASHLAGLGLTALIWFYFASVVLMGMLTLCAVRRVLAGETVVAK